MGYNPQYGRKNSDNELFEALKTYAPKSLANMIKEKSQQLGLPISKLIAIAIDNEFDSETPFNYPCPMPEDLYEEDKYMDEAVRMFDYMKKLPPIGTGRDMLILARRDMKIPTRELAMQAYRQLSVVGMFEETKVPSTSVFKGYLPTYKYTRIAKSVRGAE